MNHSEPFWTIMTRTCQYEDCIHHYIRQSMNDGHCDNYDHHYDNYYELFCIIIHYYTEVSWNGGTPKSSIFVWDFPLETIHFGVPPGLWKQLQALSPSGTSEDHGTLAVAKQLWRRRRLRQRALPGVWEPRAAKSGEEVEPKP